MAPADVDAWERYTDQEPWGDECLYLALLCTWFYNANFVPKDGKLLTVDDVIQHVEAIKLRGSNALAARQQTPEQIASALKSWAMSRIKLDV